MKKSVCLAFAFMLSLCMLSPSARAWSWSSEKLSEGSTAGVYTTYSTVINLLYSNDLSYVCGGDVQANLYEGTRGLQSTFYRATNRYIMAMLMEMDEDEGTSTRLYMASFRIDAGDYYHPATWYCDEIYNRYTSIEADGDVELRIKVWVGTHNLDLTTSVPAKIFKYKVAVVE